MLDLNDTPPAGRYVPLRVIREAIKGRETEILDKLGIAWRSSEARRT